MPELADFQLIPSSSDINIPLFVPINILLLLNYNKKSVPIFIRDAFKFKN